jgi:predicted TPR repeat methyltransferase
VPHRQPAGTAAAVAAASHHHQEGLLACRQGRTAAAIALFERALAILPEFAEAHNNLGVLLHAGGDPTGAARHFERALSLNPGYAEAHNNLGAVFQGQGRVPEATLEFERAVAASPAYPDALNNLAMALFAQDRFEAAITRWQQVLALAPDHHGAEVCIGKALYGLFLADADAARRLARRVLADHPASPVIRHAAAGIIGEVTPDRAETGYITALFDFFAPNFDDALGRLSYSPGTLVALLAREWPATGPRPDILDAGCGTGLAAGFLRPLAGILSGCDLSRQMLERARATGHYDRLVEAELVGFLAAHPESVDMVVAADVLIYFGDLVPLFAAVRTALRPGGLFACSLESGDGGVPAGAGFVLSAGGRYRHTSRALRELAEGAGFGVRQMLAETQRWESGQPIPGLKLIARKEPL